MHAAARVTFGHFLVQNAASGCHPLNIARGHTAFIAERVAVRNFTRQHISDGLNAAMRVPGKTG
jgi:hypothetical protein